MLQKQVGGGAGGEGGGGRGTVCQESTTGGGDLLISGKDKTYQYTDLIAVKLAIWTFNKGKSVTTSYIQIENTTALS